MAVTTKLDVLLHNINLDYFKDKTLTGRSKDQGYNYFTLGYIHSINLCEINANEVDIKAKCYRSMRKNEAPHKVNITVMKDEKIISDSNCTCVAGLSGTCSHVVGLVHTICHYQNLNLKEVPSELSATSLPQQWHKPRGRKIKAQPVVSMTLANPTTPTSERKRKPVFTEIPQVDLPGSSSSAILKLKEDDEIPLSYLLQENATTIDTRLGKVQTGSLLYFHLQHYEEPQSVDVTACGNTKFPIQVTNIIDDLYKCCNEFIPISIEEAMNLENVTVRQFDCTEWFNQRKKRITASQFARVAKRKKQVNEKFLQSLFDPKKFSSAATSYGTANETVAKEQYAEKYKDNHLHDCGLVVNPGFSFLGATPDGKLCSNGTTGIIEIKCPYAVRDLKIEEAVVTANFCLQKNGDVLVMNKGHDYYYQVQGQLLLTGAPFCEFIVYTKSDMADFTVLCSVSYFHVANVTETKISNVSDIWTCNMSNNIFKSSNVCIQ